MPCIMEVAKLVSYSANLSDLFRFILDLLPESQCDPRHVRYHTVVQNKNVPVPVPKPIPIHLPPPAPEAGLRLLKLNRYGGFLKGYPLVIHFNIFQ